MTRKAEAVVGVLAALALTSFLTYALTSATHRPVDDAVITVDRALLLLGLILLVSIAGALGAWMR